jgi:hypothetical protein
MIGEATIGTTTLSTTPCHLTSPAEASAAPTRPPTSACDDEDGRPSRHVMRFHTMAPISAEATSTSPWLPSGAEMMPFPTVSATPVASSAPIRLATAAMASAAPGRSARVDTEVATAFAASWNPLV